MKRTSNKMDNLDWVFELPYRPKSAFAYGLGLTPRTLNELRMMEFSASIRSKPKWFEKMHDPEILAKWQKEAKKQRMSENEIKYVFSELEYYNSIRDGLLHMSGVDGIWQADNLIESELKSELVKGVSLLENVPDDKKDWHPNSNQQVLDLVHPSLYCFVKGVTRQTKHKVFPTLKFIGCGEVIDDDSFKQFQWLPSEFDVDQDGHVKICSYINNLHPIHHRNLYHTIGRIFERFIPLFNKVLTNLLQPHPLRIKATLPWYPESPSPPRKERKTKKDVNKGSEGDEPGGEDDDNDDDVVDEDFGDWREHRRRQVIVPEPKQFHMPPPPEICVDLRGRRLQVIVKLANIILTPQKPRYAGGTWHVEGMEHEMIVSSGIYYYHSENISESKLAFRCAVREPDYEQGDDEGVDEVYGLTNGGPLNQDLGSVVTSEGRCISFPNLFQHQVQPFRLENPEKPGIRKILVFFLIDPTKRILSTEHVPPQQQEWMEELLKSIFVIFPMEVIKIIVGYIWPMPLESAIVFREELMKERKYFIEENNGDYFERPFSLCEH